MAPPTPGPTEPQPSPSPADPSARRPRRVGRRVAIALYYLVVVSVAVAGAVQITQQVFFVPAGKLPFASCHEGLRALFSAVERARAEAAGSDGEDAALDRYRRALAPEWGYRDGVAASCQGSPKDERALDAIERLRYAEEHAVRREAGELAPLRRSVRAIIDGELAPPGHP